MKKLLLVAGIALLVAACVQEGGQGSGSSAAENLHVYFYYYPTCPWCRMVKPYVQELKNESGANIVFCNVKDFENCSEEAKKVAEEAKLRGVPTAVAVNESGIMKIFVGAYEVAELGSFLKAHGYKAITNYTVGGLNYTARDCVECHAKKNLPPPSRYSCDECCHE